MTDSTPSGGTVDEIFDNADAWCWCEKDECQQNKQRIQAKHSLRQAIEGMIERVVSRDEPQTENGLLPDRVDRRNQLRSEQRTRAKEEINKLFGKE